MKVSRRGILAVVIVAVIAVSGGAYYFTNAGGGGSASSVTVNIEITNGDLANGAADTFSPRIFAVAMGQNVTLVVHNADDGPHELLIPVFGADTGIIQSGSTTRVSFVPQLVGVFDFLEPPGVCDAGGLTPAHGGCTGKQEMTGSVTVACTVFSSWCSQGG